MFKVRNKGFFAFIVTLFMLVPFASNAQDGEALFNSKCATCHTPHKDMTGPKLYNVRTLWEEGGAGEGMLHQWVRNWQVAAAKDPFAAKQVDWSPSAMSFFPNMTDDEIEAIFDYVDAQPDPKAAAAAPAGGAGGGSVAQTTDAGDSLHWSWYLMGAISLIVIIVYAAMSNLLVVVKDLIAKDGSDKDNKDSEGGAKGDESSDFDLKAWSWKNKKYIGVFGLVFVIGIVVWLFLGLYSIGVTEAYQPSQPIAFPHDIHAGINGIDCKYCHNSANKSKTAGLPTTNLCMNCHKQISGEGDQIEKIKKIYKSAGFSPEGGGQYGGETESIVWNKVHTLPDYVFFSHQQHVEVGGVDCAQCHGDMTKQHETARVVPVEELNQIEGNIQLTRPTLTMGWCIECHDVKEVSSGPLNKEGGYYEEIHKRLLEHDEALYTEYLADGKVTVRELGGWECAKCHY